MRRRIVALVAAVATLMGVVLAQSAAADARTAHPGFVTQAEAAGLSAAEATALQAKVDGYLARLDGRGTQIAPNQIDLHGAVLTVTVPGETHTRLLGTAADVTPADTACTGSGAEYKWFCAYSGEYFSGDVISMFYCTPVPIPWASTGSWDNNQTKGTRPWLYWTSGIAPWHMPAAPSHQLTGVDWLPVAAILPCDD